MIRNLLTAAAAATLLAACGGNTSVYFCSGSDEFCKRTWQPDDDSTASGAAASADEAAQASANALEIARKTPVLIEQGLAMDSLEQALNTSPDAVGGWLLAASLGLLVDDSDNAAASRFFDQNRYWLAGADPLGGDSEVLEAGVLLLADVAETRDPAVAEDASGLAKEVTLAWETPSPDIGVTARNTMASGLTDTCCSAAVLASAAVVLCDDLGSPDATANDPSLTPQVCAVARGWLTELSR